MWYIPSLRRIAVLQASDLSPSLRSLSLSGEPVPVIAAPVTLNFHGKASLRYELDSSSQLRAKSELSFSTTEAVGTDAPLAFIAEDHRGRRFLIGAFEPPFPQVKQTVYTGASPSDTYAVSVTVSWPHAPMICTALLS